MSVGGGHGCCMRRVKFYRRREPGSLWIRRGGESDWAGPGGSDNHLRVYESVEFVLLDL